MNILVVEDESKTASLLKEVIENHHDYLVVNICRSVEESVQWLQKNQHKTDLIFMDIQLSDGQSFDIFDQVQVTVPVIFCTAYDEFTLKAFKNNGIEYILKPFREDEIYKALAKVEQLKSSFISWEAAGRELKGAASQGSLQGSFLVRHREKMIPVNTADIALAFLEYENLNILTFKGEKHTIFKTIEQFEKAVSSVMFFRVNRQMMVNRSAIKEIEPYFNRKAIVHLVIPSSEKIIVSRLKVTPFLEWVENRV
jgi:two-component system, LytTR family, response regulator LytT